MSFEIHFNPSNFPEKIQKSLSTEPGIEKKLVKIDKQIKALSDIDPLSPESCQKAFKVLKDDFGMHHFDPIDPSMPTQVREVVELLKNAKKNLENEVVGGSLMTASPNQEEEPPSDEALASSLFTEKMDASEKETLLEGVQEIPSKDKKEVVALASPFSDKIDVWGMTDLLKAIKRIPSQDRKEVVALASSLFTEDMEAADLITLLQKIQRIPSKERSQIATFASSVLSRNSDAREKMIAFDEIFRVRADDREAIFLCVSSLSTEVRGALEVGELLETIRRMSPKDRKELFDFVSPLLSPKMDTSSKRFLFEMIQSEERKEIILLLQSLHTEGMPLFEKLEIIESLSVVMGVTDNNSLLKTIQEIPPEERKEVVTFASFLVTEDMGVARRSHLLKTIQEIPSQERHEIFSFLSPLSAEGMDTSVKNFLSETIRSTDRKEILLLIQSLYTEEMALSEKLKAIQALSIVINVGDKNNLLKTVLKIPSQERREVVILASSLFTENMSMDEKKVLLKMVEKIPPEERHEVIDFAAPFLTEKMDAHVKKFLFEILQSEARYEIILLARSICAEKTNLLEKIEALKLLSTALENEPCISINKLFHDFGFISTNLTGTIDLLIKQFGFSILVDVINDKDNKAAVFQLFSELVDKDETQVMEMFSKSNTMDIANNFSKMAGFLPPHLLIALTTLLLSKEYDFVLEHSKDFPIHCLSAATLSEYPELQEKFPARIILSKFQIQNKTEIVFGDHSNISLDQLLTFFDTINFTKPDQPGYVAPSICVDDGVKMSPNDFKVGLRALIDRIKNKDSHLGVPVDENERAKWYVHLERILKEVIRLSNEISPLEPTLVATEIVRLGAAGHHCGGRWLVDSIAAVNTLSGRWDVDIQSQGMSEIMTSWINNYKEGILETLTLKIASDTGELFQPHIFNAIAKSMIDYGIQPPNADSIDINDPMMSKMIDSKKEQIRDKFDEYLAIGNLSTFIGNRINEEIALNRGPFIDAIVTTMRDIAESQIGDQLQALEETLTDKKRNYGEAKAKQLLQEEEIKLAIINDDKETLGKKDKLIVSRIRSQFNGELSNQVEEQMERLPKSDELQVEKEVRDSAKKIIEQNIAKYTHVLGPNGNSEELKALGAERATSELKAAKDSACDEYLEKEGLLVYQETEGYTRPQISPAGAKALLNFLESEQDVAFPLIPATGRRNLEENITRLNDEFTNCLYIRTFSDPQFEYDNVISQKIAAEEDPLKQDRMYWSSTSTVQAGLRNELWRGGTNDRCGLAISSKAELGGWNSRDMGTENVPPTATSDDEIKQYFPNHFPKIDLPAILNSINRNDETARELVEDILGLPEKTANNDDFKKVENFLTERINPEHVEHTDLLSRIPEKYKSSFTKEEVQERMKKMAKERHKQEYNEAKIHYRPDDILAVFVFNDPGSLAKGAELQKRLATSGIIVPMVTIEENKGSMHVYKQAKEIPQYLP